jgi:hypothetical protein
MLARGAFPSGLNNGDQIWWNEHRPEAPRLGRRARTAHRAHQQQGPRCDRRQRRPCRPTFARPRRAGAATRRRSAKRPQSANPSPACQGPRTAARHAHPWVTPTWPGSSAPGTSCRSLSRLRWTPRRAPKASSRLRPVDPAGTIARAAEQHGRLLILYEPFRTHASSAFKEFACRSVRRQRPAVVSRRAGVAANPPGGVGSRPVSVRGY